MILCSNSSKKSYTESAISMVTCVKAQCYWAKDIEHFGTS